MPEDHTGEYIKNITPQTFKYPSVLQVGHKVSSQGNLRFPYLKRSVSIPLHNKKSNASQKQVKLSEAKTKHSRDLESYLTKLPIISLR